MKVKAVREVAALYDFLRDAEVYGADVASGVLEQPQTLEETMQGAKNRARGAFKNCEYSFGLESGLFLAGERWMDHTVCVIYDGQKYAVGFSPAFEVPGKVMQYVLEEKLDLDQASYRAGLSAEKRVGRLGGLVGILTQGVMDRKEYMKPAVIMAMIGVGKRIDVL